MRGIIEVCRGYIKIRGWEINVKVEPLQGGYIKEYIRNRKGRNMLRRVRYT